MAERIYKPNSGVVSPDGTVFWGGGASLVGPAPQWGDSLDSSYAYYSLDFQVPSAFLPPIDFTDFTGIKIRMRASKGTPGDVIGEFGVRLATDLDPNAGTSAYFGGLADQPNNGPTDYDTTQSSASFLPTAVKNALEQGTGVIRMALFPGPVYIHELWVVLTVPDAPAPLITGGVERLAHGFAPLRGGS